ncbi:P-type DNA transfer ATPase VirB11 [Aminobacter aganoensis]|uniref:P-type DNA transfer ATPase VirB11 n=1 Tax=Aminobacter aganoensis TaxID=83264 RepID=UPI0033869DC8
MNAASPELASDNRHYFLYRALAPLTAFLEDRNVVEISVNRPGQIYVERLGSAHMEYIEIPELTTAEIVNIGERVAASTNQFVSSANPILSAALPTGERIQVVLPPAAPDGGTLSIRKQVISNFTLEDYRDQGSLDQVAVAVGGLSETDQALIDQLSAHDIYGFIRTAIVNRVSILISGGTSSGKTTFLNACLKSVDPHERIITLEDTRELFPPQKNAVHLLASRGDQGTASVTIQSLLEASLRMRPDRLFVGEVRDRKPSPSCAQSTRVIRARCRPFTPIRPLGAYEQLAMMVMQSGLSAAYPKADLISYIQSVIPIVVQLRREGGRRGISEIFFARERMGAP